MLNSRYELSPSYFDLTELCAVDRRQVQVSDLTVPRPKNSYQIQAIEWLFGCEHWLVWLAGQFMAGGHCIRRQLAKPTKAEFELQVMECTPTEAAGSLRQDNFAFSVCRQNTAT